MRDAGGEPKQLVKLYADTVKSLGQIHGEAAANESVA